MTAARARPDVGRAGARPAWRGARATRGERTLRPGSSAGERAVPEVRRGAQRPDELRDAREALRPEVLGDALIDRLADHGVVEERRADADRGGAGNQELQRIARTRDAALADDRNAVRVRHLVHLAHLEERNGLDGGPGEAPLHVADHGAPRAHVDRHAHDGVDHRERVRARLDAAARVLADVGLIRRELGDEGLPRHAAARGPHPRGTAPEAAEGHPAFLHVRAGDVDFHGIDPRLIEAPRDLDVLLDGGTADVCDEARLAEVELREDAAHYLIDPGVLQPDGIQHAGRSLVHPVRGIAEARLAGRALEHDGAGVAVREALDPGVLLAEADAAREQHDRRGEIEAR